MSDSIDVSQVRALAKDLGHAGPEAIPKVRAVLQKGALNIKNDLISQARASGIREARALSSFITYTSKESLTGATFEVGPAEGSAGSFAFLYFGNSKNGPVLPDPGDALNREAPAIERYIEGILGGAL